MPIERLDPQQAPAQEPRPQGPRPRIERLNPDGSAAPTPTPPPPPRRMSLGDAAMMSYGAALNPAGAFGALANQIAERGGRVGAFVDNARDSLALGFADELDGVQSGVGAMLRGGNFSDAYQQRVRQARSRLERLRAQHPISSLAGNIAGIVPTAVVGGTGLAAAASRGALGGAGRYLAAQGAGRGAGAYLAQGAMSAPTGALAGGVYRYGSNEGNLAQRMEGVPEAAALSGATAFAFPAIGQGLTSRNLTSRLLGGAAAGGIAGPITNMATGRPVTENLPYWIAGGAGAGAAGAPVLREIGRRWRGAPRVPSRIVQQSDRALAQNYDDVAGLRARTLDAPEFVDPSLSPASRPQFAHAADPSDLSRPGGGAFSRRLLDAQERGAERRALAQGMAPNARSMWNALRGDLLGLFDDLSRPGAERTTASVVRSENEALRRLYGSRWSRDPRTRRELEELLYQLDDLEQSRARRGGRVPFEEGIFAAPLYGEGE